MESLPRLERIEVLEVAVPRTQRRVVTAYGDIAESRYALVRIAADGLTGIGEAPAECWWTGEDAVTVRNAVERYLAPALIGREPTLAEAAGIMNCAVAASPYAKAAVETALWDLVGKQTGKPLHRLLGGPTRPVSVKYGIGAVSPAEAREAVAAGKELGFAWFKVKGTADATADRARFQAVAETLGQADHFGVDANAAWTRQEAFDQLDALGELAVAFLEQPIARRDAAGLVELRSRAPMPVIAHESLFTVEDGLRAAADGIADVWALTPGTHGGLLATLELVSLAREQGIGCLLGSTFELGIATALMAHLASAVDELALGAIPSDVVGPLYHEDDVVRPRPEIMDGTITPPEGPGLGVELDPEQLRRFGVGTNE